MTLQIRSNIASLGAQRQLALSNAAHQLTVQRTSSGSRINSAKDDSAGLAIADRMTSKVRGYTQAARNVNEAVSYTLTAGAGLDAISNVLQRLRQLAVQAGNATMSRTDRATVQDEASDLIDEINGHAAEAKFNGKRLLDGSQGPVSFQVGSKATDMLGVTIKSAKAADIGQRALESSHAEGAITLSSAVAGSARSTFANNGLAAQTLTITGADSGKPVSSKALQLKDGDSAKTVAAAINGVTEKTGVSASASTQVTISGITHLGSVMFTLWGTNKGAVPITANVNDLEDLSSVAKMINAKSGMTDITASADKQGNLVLKQAGGSDIGLINQGLAGQGLDGAKFRGADVQHVNADGSISLVAGASVTLGDASTASNAAKAGGTVALTSSSDYIVNTTAAGTLFASDHSVSVFTPLNGIRLDTLAGATDAIETIDAAIVAINKSVSAVGSLQNRLDSMVGQLQGQAGAVDAARSRISDSDYASETAKLTRAQILQQAATTVMSQANATANNVMRLLTF